MYVIGRNATPRGSSVNITQGLLGVLPSILLSGFIFADEGFRQPPSGYRKRSPTHFMRIIRGVILRAADLFDLCRDGLWLLALTLFGLIVASGRFKKNLD